MLRSVSASGRTRMRTAKRFWPSTRTCATPSIVDSVGEIRFSAKSLSSDRLIDGERSETISTGASAGLTLRYDGGVVISAGSVRCARNSAACTSTAAASMSRAVSNSSTTAVCPSVLLELMVVSPAMVENCFSNGSATELAIVSGSAPGKYAVTWITGVL